MGNREVFRRVGGEFQEKAPLVAALQASASRHYAPFHTPGHKRGQGISPLLAELIGYQGFRADLPELPELDNLFAPQGVIQAAQELAAEVFGAEQTWFLANGSTCGVVAAILATCEPGDKIILPRNIHQSAISGLILAGAVPIFIQPEYDLGLNLAHSITSATIEGALKQHPDAKAVMMVYPTYYGVCGDVAAIAHVAHQHHIPLLVDEAHGAHFAFHPDLPISALAAGADLTVQSTHKTLGALTQAAMLHLQGTRIDPHRLSQSLQLVQSTSPSYLLLASLDAARHQMATQGKELMEQVLHLADNARTRINQIAKLSTLNPSQAGTPGFFALDRTRLTVTVADLGMDGFTTDEILHGKLGVTAELPSPQHLTFIISLGNIPEEIEQLVSAFEQLSKQVSSPQAQNQTQPLKFLPYFPTPISQTLSPRAAFFAASDTLVLEHAVNRISAELICPYPPGIPVLMPGEVITEEAIAYLKQIMAAGGMISGCADASLQTLRVVRG